MSIIRSATSEDINEIYLLGRNVSEFSVNDDIVNFWPKPLLKNAISSKDTLVIVAEENEKIVGFIIAIYDEGFRKSIVENVYVDADLRNLGIGRMLLENVNISLRSSRWMQTEQLNCTKVLDFLKASSFCGWIEL